MGECAGGNVTETDGELDAERLNSLYRVSSGLAAARTPSEVADVVVTAGSPVLGGVSGSLCVLLDDGETFELVRSEGYLPSVQEEFARFPLAAPLPAGDAVRRRGPVFLESLEDRNQRYPVIADHPAKSQAFAVLPLFAEDRALGVFTVGFPEPRTFDDDEVAFLLNLADQCAQALARTQAFAAVEALAARLAFLAEASAALASSLDVDEILPLVAALLVPAVAIGCRIEVDGTTVAMGDHTEGVSIPLVARGRTLGVVTVVCLPAELDLVGQVVARAAVAVDNAQLYTASAEVARTLQHALLPPALPEIPGVELAARYLPASSALEVGGDFYDAFPISPTRWVLAVGDVCGRRVEAATVTGAARHAIRSAATRTSSPAEILATLDDVLCAEAGEGEDRFCTAAVAVVERDDGRITLTVAGAGHPPPLLRQNGTVVELDVEGPLLGAGLHLGPERREVVVDLDPGDVLLLYTDGLTEARRDRAFFDGAGLVTALEGASGGAGDLADAVVSAVHAHVGGAIDDDAAALVAIVTG